MDRLQKDYISGALVPSKIIHFSDLTTDVSMDVTALGDYNGTQILDVLAWSGFFAVPTLNFRVSNLHRPGAAYGSDVWVVIPDNIVVPKLVQKLYQGGIDKISIMTYDYIDAGGETDQARITQVIEYTSCFLKFVDPMSYGLLTLFCFSYVKVKMIQVDIRQVSQGGKNENAGQFVYEFDFTTASGKKSA